MRLANTLADDAMRQVFGAAFQMRFTISSDKTTVHLPRQIKTTINFRATAPLYRQDTRRQAEFL
jgi:hypothetical protein